jgi:tetratricopeptide (TPR) repeat protein
MAKKARAKPKSAQKMAKPAKAPAKAPAKSAHLKAKSVKSARKAPAKTASKKPPRPTAKSPMRPPVKRTKAETRRTAVATASSSSRSTSPERVRSKHFANAIQAYEAGIKLMHAEQFEKAIRCFEDLVAEHPEEPEIQERAKVLIHASEKKIQEKGRTVLRSADDHYNVGIADLNRRALSSAIEHLQHALKMAPKADHILYALATANALEGNREQALHYLKQSIHHRPENRFLAARDSDFAPLQDDTDFKQLVTSEK